MGSDGAVLTPNFEVVLPNQSAFIPPLARLTYEPQTVESLFPGSLAVIDQYSLLLRDLGDSNQLCVFTSATAERDVKWNEDYLKTRPIIARLGQIIGDQFVTGLVADLRYAPETPYQVHKSPPQDEIDSVYEHWVTNRGLQPLNGVVLNVPECDGKRKVGYFGQDVYKDAALELARIVNNNILEYKN